MARPVCPVGSTSFPRSVWPEPQHMYRISSVGTQPLSEKVKTNQTKGLMSMNTLSKSINAKYIFVKFSIPTQTPQYVLLKQHRKQNMNCCKTNDISSLLYCP